MKSKFFVQPPVALFLFFTILLITPSLFGKSISRRNIFESAMYDNVKDFSRKIGFFTNVNQKDKAGCPLLFYTMRFMNKGKQYENMVLLLNKGSNIESRDKYGRTPLIAAVRIEAKNMVHELLKRGAKVEVFDNENRGPLAHAIKKDLLSIAKLLLEAKTNPNHVVMKINSGRQSIWPIQLAAKMRNPKMLKLLFSYGATYDLSKDSLLNLNINCRDETVLERAGRLACIEILLRRSKPQSLGKEWFESMALNKLLLKYKMNVDWKSLSREFPRSCSYHIKIEAINFLLSQNKMAQMTLDSALVRAVNLYRLDIVKSLLDAGARADQHTARYGSAWKNAQRGRDPEIILALTQSLKKIPNKPLKKKRYINQQRLEKIKTFSSAKANIMLKKEISSPSSQVVVKTLIARGADVNSKYSNSDTLLHRISRSPEITELLLKSGANPNLQNKYGKTPLFNANPVITVILLKYGADPNLTDKYKQTPLFYSSIAKTRALLRAGAKVNVVDKKGRTPLFYANSIKAKLLIAAGADVNVKDHSGDTPLTRTISGFPKFSVKADIFDVLLTGKPKIDANTMSRFVICQPIEILQRLQPFAVKKNTSSSTDKTSINNKQKVYSGRVPVVVAAERGNTPALKILLKTGNYTKSELNLALQRAVRDANNLECVKLLLLAGADVNALDWNKNNTAFSMGVGKNKSKIFFHLLQAGGDVNWKNPAGYTLLHRCSSPKVASFLVTRLDVNARDNQLQTPLHRFARYDSNALLIAILLKAGANPNLQDAYGRTPLYIAMSVKPWHSPIPEKIIKLLKDAGAKELPDKNGVKPSDLPRLREQKLKRQRQIYNDYLKRTKHK